MTTLEKIRAELHATAEMHEDGDYYLRDKWVDEIIDKYAEQEPKVTTISTDEPMVIQYPQVDGITPTVVKAEQEPCDDAVSRQNIIDTYESCADMLSDEELEGANLVMEWIYKAQSVRPQEQTGKK